MLISGGLANANIACAASEAAAPLFTTRVGGRARDFLGLIVLGVSVYTGSEIPVSSTNISRSRLASSLAVMKRFESQKMKERKKLLAAGKHY